MGRVIVCRDSGHGGSGSAARGPALCRRLPCFAWFCWRCWRWPRLRTCTPTRPMPTTASYASSCTRWCLLRSPLPLSCSCTLAPPPRKPNPLQLPISGKSASLFALRPSPYRASFRFQFATPFAVAIRRRLTAAMLRRIPQANQSRDARTGSMLSEHAEIAAASRPADRFPFHSAIFQETFLCSFTVAQSYYEFFPFSPSP
jgi:hypothetical protein